jgi:predicted porin
MSVLAVLHGCNAKPLFLGSVIAERMSVWFNTCNFPKTEVGSGKKAGAPIQTLENLEMKKTLVALAALAATSAFAQVTIYGRANVDVSQYSATGAATAANDLVGRTRVADSGSRIGFRINEDLGGGLRAFSVIETGINLDNGGTDGQGVGVASGTASAANSAAGHFGTREAHIGIGNSAYEVRLGRQNVFWTHGELNQTGANFLSGDVIGAFTAPGSGFSAAVASRQNNTILLQLNNDSVLGKNFAGSNIYYSTNGGESVTTATATPDKSSLQGFKINYNMGPYVAMYDNVAVKSTGNSAGTANIRTDASNFDAKSTKWGIGYKYAEGSLISLSMFEHERTYNLAASHTAAATWVNATGGATGSVGSRKQSGSGINLVHNLGGGMTAYAQMAKFGKAKDYAGADIADSGAKATMIGIRKDLSKRTGVYAWTGKITNEAANGVNWNGGSYASGNSAAGADPKVTAIGIMHNF